MNASPMANRQGCGQSGTPNAAGANSHARIILQDVESVVTAYGFLSYSEVQDDGVAHWQVCDASLELVEREHRDFSTVRQTSLQQVTLLLFA